MRHCATIQCGFSVVSVWLPVSESRAWQPQSKVRGKESDELMELITRVLLFLCWLDNRREGRLSEKSSLRSEQEEDDM